MHSLALSLLNCSVPTAATMAEFAAAAAEHVRQTGPRVGARAVRPETECECVFKREREGK